MDLAGGDDGSSPFGARTHTGDGVDGAGSDGIKAIALDPASSLPPWLQIKERIKVAYTCGNLRPGETLPSIREMSARLQIGQGTVRRAYNELIELGLLQAVERKGFRVVDRPLSPDGVRHVTDEATAECDRLILWARRKRLSPVAFSRLLHGRAHAAEAATPCYAYVSASTTAARRFAAIIAKAWEVNVTGWSLEELAALPKQRLDSMAAILVNHVRYENVERLVPRDYSRVFTIRLHLNPGLVRRMRRLPTGTRVLLLFSREDLDRIGGVVADIHNRTVGPKLSYECVALEDIGDLSSIAERGEYGLIVVSIHQWEQIPPQVRRKRRIVCSQFEPDPLSLEDARLKAGVLA